MKDPEAAQASRARSMLSVFAVSRRRPGIADRPGRNGAVRFALCLAAFLSAFAGIGAADTGTPIVEVREAWALPTVPGQEVAAVYMNITSAHNATLVKIESKIAGSVQIHNMRMDGQVMKMRELKDLPLPAGATVKLAPGGNHLMMTQLKKPLRLGESVPLSLTIVKADGSKGVVRVTVPVARTPPRSR